MGGGYARCPQASRCALTAVMSGCPSHSLAAARALEQVFDAVLDEVWRERWPSWALDADHLDVGQTEYQKHMP
ncbi:MAG: hypothetical protein M3R46_03855 [Actinomycetota bacterium]|nr:hypothetical protein [Actinomycetota bacterium]